MEVRKLSCATMREDSSRCHVQTDSKTQRKKSLLILAFWLCSSWTFGCATLHLSISVAAFVPSSCQRTISSERSWGTASRSEHQNWSTRRVHNLLARRQQKQKTNQNNPKSVDISNILADMGLKQVNATNSQSSRKDANRTKKKKKNVTSTAASTSQEFPDVSVRTQLEYARNGHAVLRNFIGEKSDRASSSNISNTKKNKRLSVLRRDLLNLAVDQELKAWVQKVQVAAGKDIADSCHCIQDCQRALDDVGVTASLPFLQYFNTWRQLPAVKDLAYDLGKAASILLDVPTVRLYQDAVFWKRSQDGPTPWHADARMAPFDTSHMITFWIPLQEVPSPENGGTALIFCSKSHADFALPYWNPLPDAKNPRAGHNISIKDDKTSYVSGWDRLEDRYPKKVVDYMPMSVGDVTIHSGWTLHCSNGNQLEGSKDRVALAISFVDGSAEIRPDWKTVGDDEDRWSYQDWCNDITPRKKFSHDLVPIVWPPSQRD